MGTPGREADPLLGALYFDLDRDDRFAPDRDFELSPLIVDSGSGPKASYSLRLIEEAQRRDLYGGARPDHIPDSDETTAFWALHDAEPSLKEAVVRCPDLAVMVYGSARDHMQAAPDHPHILSGWVLQDDNDTHSFTFPDVVLEPRSYLIIAANADGTDAEGRPLATGLYLYQLITEGHHRIKKMLLIR